MNKWNQRYLDIAKEVSTWSKDPSRRIGAVIVGDKGQIISQGYNGFPRGIEDYEYRYENREIKYKYVVHAEANAIYNAIHNGANTDGAIMYVTGLPVCHECAKAIIQVGIKKVVMDTEESPRWDESSKLALEMFREAGLEYEFLKETDGSI